MKLPGLYFVLPLLILSFTCFSQSTKYSKVQIFTDQEGLRQLSSEGVTIDHGHYRKGVSFTSDFSEDEIQIMRSLGFNIEILIEDVIDYYVEQNKEESNHKSRSSRSGHCEESENYPVPDNFSLGSMGGYFTYVEFLAHLDTMASKFPNLITAKAPVDTFESHENRPLYWLKISDNPNVDENEPEVLYDAIHHAREPGSLSQLIFYMYYLLENYGINDEITYLVDNTEMYFIPMVNPDGYIYNETTNPSGGGMWRKNRRDNGDGTFGVDLNRNYEYEWGYDNDGSSPTTSSQVYRGPYATSEPEIQAMQWFCEQRDFKISLNYHTYGDLFIYPWGHKPAYYTPDSALFVDFAKVMTSENSYTYGTGDQTVGYVVNGDSDDWMYGEQTSKSKIMSCTPEVGNSFWPPSSSIVSLCQDNIRQNLNMAHLANKYAVVQDQSPSVINQYNGYFDFSIKRMGLDSPASFTVEIIPIGPEITSIGGSKTFSSLFLMEERVDSISYSLDSNIQSGQEFSYVLAVDNGLYTAMDTITKIFGFPSGVFFDDASTMGNWSSGSWGVSNTVYYSPSGSITDSPSGNYGNSSNTDIVLNNAIDLSTAVSAKLSYWARWEIETGYDYVQVMASDDNGNTWAALCGKYTVTGNGNQDTGNPLYHGFQTDWVKEEISLDDYIGANVLIRFRLISDGWVNEDGFYFDDISMEIIEAPMEISFNIDSATCNSADGIIEAIVSGGTSPYYYSWSDAAAQTTSTATGLVAGIYYLTVTDFVGNSVVDTAIVNNSGGLGTDLFISDITCFGWADGAVKASATNGTSPYSYNWSTGLTTDSIGALSAGNYLLTTTDLNGCQHFSVINLAQPDSLLLTITEDNIITCNGSSDGAVMVNALGGVSPYTYIWSTNSTSQSISGLGPGTYNVTVSGTNGCVASDGIYLSEPASLSLTATVTESNSTPANGSIDLEVSGGTSPYVYLWSNGATNQDINNLSQGNYTVTVTDSNGCTNTLSETVISTVGIQDVDNQFIHSIFPNPTTGIFTIELDEKTEIFGEIVIHNLLGQEIYRQPALKNRTKIDLSENGKGIYFITFRQGEDKHLERFKLVVN